MRKNWAASGILCLATSFVAICPSATSQAAPPPAENSPRQLYDSGHYREAERALTAAIATNGQNGELHYWLGRSAYELRDYSLAVTSFEHAVMLDANESDYHDWLGRAYGRKAEETNVFAAFASLALARRANHEFATAVRLDSGNLTAQRDYIRYLMNAPGIVGGSEDHAREQIKLLAAIDRVESELASGELSATHKKFDEAGATYQRILTGPPTRLAVYLEIAQYYRDREDGVHVDQTAGLAARVAHDDPHVGYYQAVGLILLKKDLGRAEGYLRNYLAMVPDNTEVPSHASAHEWLGRLYESQGRLDPAAGEYQAALTLDPRNKNLHDALRRLQSGKSSKPPAKAN